MKTLDIHLLFRIIIGLLVTGILLIRVPQALIYLLGLLVMSLIIWKVGIMFHKATAKKCPKCGDALSDDGFTQVFSGTRNLDGGPNFDALAYRVKKCDDCGTEQWRFFIPPSYSGNKADQLDLARPERDFWGKKVMGMEFTDFENRGMTLKEYQQMVFNLKELIVKHNLEAGFMEQDLRQEKQFEKEMIRYDTKNPLLKGNFLTIAATLFVTLGIILGLAKPFIVPALFTPRIIEGEVVAVENVTNTSRLIIEYEGDREYKYLLPKELLPAGRFVGNRVIVKVWLGGIHTEIEY